MHSRFRATSVTLTALAALVALLVVPATLMATPKPGAPGRGFRLMARAVGAITINRVYCGLAATGEVCVDSLNSSTIGGGYWPKGSPQAYVFNSGLQAAGSVEAGIAGFTWSGDTTGAFFFDPKGTTQHGELVQPIWNSLDPADRASWPAAAMVPQGDAVADLFDLNLQGEVSASEGDVWTIAWDGNPGLNAGRRHPLGIAVETRGMGWNSPTFNDDIVYFIYTFYNITSSDPNDYLAIRPGMREIMQELGVRFQSLNNAAFGVTIPAGGYSIENFYANFAADMDVSADAGENYSSVNLPFAMGYVYHDLFRETDGGFVLPPDIGSAPFLNGYGFVGVKYLRSPVVDPDGPGGPLPPAEVGIRLFSNTVNGGLFGDPRDAAQLFRYLSGNINQALGDGGCNNGNPFVTRVCYVKQDGHADMRFFQSSGPFTLAPGEFGSIVVGYVFASAVASPGCNTVPCASVLPGNALRLVDPGLMSIGGNLIDSLTGYRGYSDVNADGIVQQEEFTTVKGSLLAKALVAQLVFDNKFLLPAPPRTPEFFLVPGNDQVAIFWRPSATETIGDLYFSAANNPGTPASPNLLYDPNYRQFDVEGYRVYRGRVDNPSSLALLAQFDYAGTVIDDYLGAINPTADCAPELGNETGCPVNYSNPTPGNAYTVSHANDIVSPLVQVKIGDRTLLGTGLAIILAADTVPAADGFPPLEDTGVPFVYVDQTARNNLRYFYSVTAFDVNSIQSGPSSLESARVTKAVTPFRPASNYDNAGALDIGVFGRGVNMTAAIPSNPAIDATTGVFSGPARPATGADIGFVGQFIAQVVTQSGEMSVRLDSMAAGSAYNNAPSTFWYSVISSAGTVPFTASIVQNQFNVPVSTEGTIDGGPIDANRAARYGGSNAYHLAGAFELAYQGNYYTASFGRGCVNGAPGFGAGRSPCSYNGARWFDGAAETFPHPNRGNNDNALFSAGGQAVTVFTNAGSVAGVDNIHEGRSYQNRGFLYRFVEGVLGTASTAADYRVYWGATPGTVDSVIDITHNVPVAFSPDIQRGYTWGFLTSAAASVGGNSADGRAELSITDLGCVAPLNIYSAPLGHLGCPAGRNYQFVNTATPGPLVIANSPAADGANAARPNPGFGMYLAGHFFLFELSGATAPSNTVWTMRSYIGAIRGGGGAVGTAGNQGAYTFTSQPSPFTAVGATLSVAYSVTNQTTSTTEGNLAEVHTVPDPYYVTNQFERTSSAKVIKFVNLPDKAIVRIYSTSGVLVRVLEHNSSQFSGTLDWDVRNRNNQVVASGVYFYHIESPSGARRVGRMTIVNFAQ